MGGGGFRRRWLLAAAAATMAIAAVTAAPAHGRTEMRIVGATNLVPGFLLPGYQRFTAGIGSGFYPDADASIVGYPASIWPVSGLLSPTMGRSVRIGADNLEAQLRAANGPLVVSSLSQGTLVSDAVQARLADDPGAPAADQLAFTVFSDPGWGNPDYGGVGLFSLLPERVYIPIYDLVITYPVESQYDTHVVAGEYDFAGDFPNRPWNLLAVANSLLALDVHNDAALVNPDDVPAENVTAVTNSRGGTVTTYLVPTQQLPLTQPLRGIGVSDTLVDALDEKLRPIIDSAYSRNDTGSTRAPYIEGGRLVLSPPGLAADTEESLAAEGKPTADTEDVVTPAGPDRAQARHAQVGLRAAGGLGLAGPRQSTAVVAAATEDRDAGIAESGRGAISTESGPQAVAGTSATRNEGRGAVLAEVRELLGLTEAVSAHRDDHVAIIPAGQPG